jgi:DNA mismatch endonuclease (patch repair protein)
MADVFTPEKRSEIMSRIRSSGTTPEARLCAAVREALGGRWRIDMNVRTLPGQPDVVVPGLRLAIFADGCFYHGCPEHGHVPKSNVGYWLPKLVRNRRRDRASRRALRRMGFAVEFETSTVIGRVREHKSHRFIGNSSASLPEISEDNPSFVKRYRAALASRNHSLHL